MKKISKIELIKVNLKKNQDRFGKYASVTKPDDCDPTKLNLPPENNHESTCYGNALVKSGNYPVGTSDCFNVGISGGCGENCFVYKAGKCEFPE